MHVYHGYELASGIDITLNDHCVEDVFFSASSLARECYSLSYFSLLLQS